MVERFQLPLAMWRVQYDLLGGHRRLLAIVAVTVTVLGAGIFGAYRLAQPGGFAAPSGFILGFLAVINAIITVLVGCNAVHRAMLRDFESKMLESHRLTPMSNLAVPFGYLFGSTIQVIALSLMLTVAGVVVSYMAGLPIDTWIYGSLFLLNGAVTLWAAAVFFGLRPEKPFNPAIVVILIGALMAPIGMVPLAAFLFNLYPVLLGLMLLTSGTAVPGSVLVIVGAVSLAFTMFWISAAAVKYRRPDLPALNGGRGLALLLLALIVGTGGLIVYDHITATSIRGFDSGRKMERIQWIATMIGALLLAAVAINGAAKCRVLGTTGTALRDWPDRMSPLLIALLSAVMICGVMAGLGQPIWSKMFASQPGAELQRALLRDAWLYSFGACVLAALSFGALFELGYRRLKSPKVIVAVLLLVVWALPVLVDSIRAAYVADWPAPARYSWIWGCSPAGTIAAAWSNFGIRLWPGLLVQVSLAGILMLAARRVQRSKGQ